MNKKNIKSHKIETKYIDCACGCSDHTIKFAIDEHINTETKKIENEVYIEVQLCKTKRFFKRIWLAIKYVCGYECRFGHWDCTIIDKKSAKDIISILKKIV